MLDVPWNDMRHAADIFYIGMWLGLGGFEGMPRCSRSLTLFCGVGYGFSFLEIRKPLRGNSDTRDRKQRRGNVLISNKGSRHSLRMQCEKGDKKAFHLV